jgi:hypothetical protein
MLRRLLLARPLRAAVGTASLLVLGSCGGSERQPFGRERSAIIGGEPSPAGIEDAVLLLRATVPEQGDRLCGASLVAPNLVVTARHCVAYVTGGRFSCKANGQLDEDDPGADPGAGRMGVDLPAEALAFFDDAVPRAEPVALGARVVSTLSDSACTNDLAFVVLDRTVDLPIVALRRSRPTLEDEAVIAVGYGADRSIDQTIDFETQKRRRKADLRVAAVGPDTAQTVGTAPPGIVIIDGPSACNGDSGGPLLSQETNALLAVHSLIQGDCVAPESRSWFTHVPPLWRWAERAFEAAGATPTLEPDPIGDPCADGDGCAGAGGESSGTGGESFGGTSNPGSGAGGDEASGAGGAPTDPGDPKPGRESRAPRDSGCSLGDDRDPWSAVPGALLLALALRRARATGGRRAGRSRAASVERARSPKRPAP